MSPLLEGISVPTEQQYARLRLLADGSMLLVPSRREWGGLVRRGWVAGVCEDSGARFLPPLRITPAGLIALAAAVERYGHLELDGEHQTHTQLREPAFVRKLRDDLDTARRERDQARRDAHRANHLVSRARRVLAEADG